MASIQYNRDPDSLLLAIVILIVMTWVALSSCAEEEQLESKSMKEYVLEAEQKQRKEIIKDSLRQDSIDRRLIKPE